MINKLHVEGMYFSIIEALHDNIMINGEKPNYLSMLRNKTKVPTLIIFIAK